MTSLAQPEPRAPRRRRGRAPISAPALVVPALVSAMALAVPAGARADGADRARQSHVGLWAASTSCRVPNDVLWSYSRRTVTVPAGALHQGTLECRIVARGGAPSLRTLDLACRTWEAGRMRDTMRMRHVLRSSRFGTRLEVAAVVPSTGEVFGFDLFYCRQRHEPEVLPEGTLEEPPRPPRSRPR